MIRYIQIIFVMVLLLTACTTLPVQETIHTGRCAKDALICAQTKAEKYEVRIMRGPCPDYGNVWHAQAQALINGKWKYLCLNESGVFVCQKHSWFNPVIISSLNFYAFRLKMDGYDL